MLPGGVLRRDIRFVLHQPHPPTASTGTTYNIEMYQCIRHAKGAIPTKSITSRPGPLPTSARRAAIRLERPRYHASRDGSPDPDADIPPAVLSPIRVRRLRTNTTNSNPATAIATPSTITPIDAFELSGVQYS